MNMCFNEEKLETMQIAFDHLSKSENYREVDFEHSSITEEIDITKKIDKSLLSKKTNLVNPVLRLIDIEVHEDDIENINIIEIENKLNWYCFNNILKCHLSRSPVYGYLRKLFQVWITIEDQDALDAFMKCLERRDR